MASNTDELVRLILSVDGEAALTAALNDVEAATESLKKGFADTSIGIEQFTKEGDVLTKQAAKLRSTLAALVAAQEFEAGASQRAAEAWAAEANAAIELEGATKRAAEAAKLLAQAGTTNAAQTWAAEANAAIEVESAAKRAAIAVQDAAEANRILYPSLDAATKAWADEANAAIVAESAQRQAAQATKDVSDALNSSASTIKANAAAQRIAADATKAQVAATTAAAQAWANEANAAIENESAIKRRTATIQQGQAADKAKYTSLEAATRAWADETNAAIANESATKRNAQSAKDTVAALNGTATAARNSAAGMNAAGKGINSAAYQMQMLGNLIDDMQYVGEQGLRPILNNVMMMSPQLGVALIAFDFFYKHFSGTTAKQAATSIEGLKDHLEALTKNPHKLAIDYRDLSVTKELISDMEKRIAAFESAKETKESKTLKGKATKVAEDFTGGSKGLAKSLQDADDHNGIILNAESDKKIGDARRKLAYEKSHLNESSFSARAEQNARMQALETEIAAESTKLEGEIAAHYRDEVGAFLTGDEEAIARVKAKAKANPEFFDKVGVDDKGDEKTAAKAIADMPSTAKESIDRDNAKKAKRKRWKDFDEQRAKEEKEDAEDLKKGKEEMGKYYAGLSEAYTNLGDKSAKTTLENAARHDKGSDKEANDALKQVQDFDKKAEAKKKAELEKSKTGVGKTSDQKKLDDAKKIEADAKQRLADAADPAAAAARKAMPGVKASIQRQTGMDEAHATIAAQRAIDLSQKHKIPLQDAADRVYQAMLSENMAAGEQVYMAAPPRAKMAPKKVVAPIHVQTPQEAAAARAAIDARNAAKAEAEKAKQAAATIGVQGNQAAMISKIDSLTASLNAAVQNNADLAGRLRRQLPSGRGNFLS